MPSHANDEEAIRRLMTEMTEAFNSHDARAATRMYMPDAELVTVRGEVMTGREQMEAGLAAIFETRAREATLRTLEMSVRFLRHDVALAHVTNELEGLRGPDGSKLPAHVEKSLRVLVKDGSEWRVASFHNTMVRPFGT